MIPQAIVQECGVTAMPTFQFFKNGAITLCACAVVRMISIDWGTRVARNEVIPLPAGQKVDTLMGANKDKLRVSFY